MSESPLRLIIDGPGDGPDNMARDEALLRRVGDGLGAATLRFYGWRPATISLGYFQDYAEFAAQPAAVSSQPVVRRTTGGGAIFHDIEVTYSLAAPIDSPWLRPNATRLYALAHTAIIRTIGPAVGLFGDGPAGGCASLDDSSDEATANGASHPQRGPFFCFARRHALDVVVRDGPGRDGKIAGSAQRRARSAVLQHGSVMLGTRLAEQSCATWSGLGGPLDYHEAVNRLLPAFEAALQARAEPEAWTTAELEMVVELRKKYDGDEWTRRR